jgi:hypothetical protein
MRERSVLGNILNTGSSDEEVVVGVVGEERGFKTGLGEFFSAEGSLPVHAETGLVGVVVMVVL